MRVCVYVCMHACVYVSVCVFVFVCMRVFAGVCVFACVHVCVCMCASACACVCVCVCVLQLDTRTYKQTCILLPIGTHTHIKICNHNHARAHTILDAYINFEYAYTLAGNVDIDKRDDKATPNVYTLKNGQGVVVVENATGGYINMLYHLCTYLIKKTQCEFKTLCGIFVEHSIGYAGNLNMKTVLSGTLL